MDDVYTLIACDRCGKGYPPSQLELCEVADDTGETSDVWLCKSCIAELKAEQN